MINQGKVDWFAARWDLWEILRDHADRHWHSHVARHYMRTMIT